jgi:hypothetical protein
MESLSLIQGSSDLALHGPGVHGAVKAARRGTPKPQAQSVLESIDIILEGTPGEILAAVVEIGRMVAAICASNLERNGQPGMLQFVPAAGCGAYRSTISGYEMQALGSTYDVQAGRAGLRLLLWREDWWEGEEISLPLDTGSGKSTSPVTICNHADAGHRGHAQVAESDLAGDLPGRAILTIQNNLSPGLALGDVWVGVCEGANAQDPIQVVEGETGSGASSQSAANASGGYFGRFSIVSPTAGATVTSWTMENPALAWWTRGLLRPVAKFYNAPAASDLWVWWKVTAGGWSYESGRVQLSAGISTQELPPITLSPLLEFGPVAAVNLELKAKGAGSSYTLDLDFVTFFPAQGTLKYKSLGTIAPGGSLVDDQWQLLSYDSGLAAFASHVRMGKAITFRPGLPHRLMLLHTGAADNQVRVSIKYRPRYRVI